jgi:hypothetical protein
MLRVREYSVAYSRRQLTLRGSARKTKVGLGYPDYSQAEPTTLKTILDSDSILAASAWPSDFYQHLASLAGVTRDEAKGYYGLLAYGPNTKATFRARKLAHSDFTRDLVPALDEMKRRIWEGSRPLGKRPARIHTLGGTLVEGYNRGRKKPIHMGTLLSWIVQGTVADILNAALIELIDREEADAWGVLFPIHDGVYISATQDRSEDVAAVLTSKAQDLRIPLRVTVRSDRARDRKRTRSRA